MRIAQIAPNIERVPPVRYGSIELVVNLLSEELVKRGHKVTLFASGDSITSAKLESVIPNSLRSYAKIDRSQWSSVDIQTMARVSDMQNSFDVVHNHMGYIALPFLAKLECPVVSTNHTNIHEHLAPIYLHHRKLPYVAISNAHRELNFPRHLNYEGTIYNGIDGDAFKASPDCRTGKYLLFMGRICPEKGTAEACEIADRLSLPLLIAGKLDEEHEEYFESRVEPYLQRSGFEYLGEVENADKIRLYQEALALVYPLQFDEPFGLVMAEAQAAGLPVMALDRGSVREIIEDGKTGIVCGTMAGIIARYPQISKISRQACRDRALLNFSIAAMVDGYEKIYRRLTGGACE